MRDCDGTIEDDPISASASPSEVRHALIQRYNPDDLVIGSVLILRAAARHFRVTRGGLLSPRRDGSVVAARHAAYLGMALYTRLSFCQIGARLLRDHTTVLTGCQRAAERLADDPEWAVAFDRMVADLRARVSGVVTRPAWAAEHGAIDAQTSSEATDAARPDADGQDVAAPRRLTPYTPIDDCQDHVRRDIHRASVRYASKIHAAHGEQARWA